MTNLTNQQSSLFVGFLTVIRIYATENKSSILSFLHNGLFIRKFAISEPIIGALPTLPQIV